jgi:ornithine cyclodeaminase/alanine dehydrogenase
MIEGRGRDRGHGDRGFRPPPDRRAERRVRRALQAGREALRRQLGSALPRLHPDDQIAVYKSVGSAIQDLAVAGLCVRRAEQLGLGVRLPVAFEPVKK